ncbi:MAG: hypothetical protein ACREJW_07555, partial [Candidatus Methylomirabilales bacterium]
TASLQEQQKRKAENYPKRWAHSMPLTPTFKKVVNVGKGGWRKGMSPILASGRRFLRAETGLIPIPVLPGCDGGLLAQ